MPPFDFKTALTGYIWMKMRGIVNEQKSSGIWNDDNPGGMESCVMNYYRNIDLDKVQFDFLCNWEQMVYADEVMKNGSKIYTIPQRSKDYKAYKKAMDSSLKNMLENMMCSGTTPVH